jgi:hypothetical protein
MGALQHLPGEWDGRVPLLEPDGLTAQIGTDWRVLGEPTTYTRLAVLSM